LVKVAAAAGKVPAPYPSGAIDREARLSVRLQHGARLGPPLCSGHERGAEYRNVKGSPG